MIRAICLITVGCLAAHPLTAAAAARTLVTKGQDGKLSPGVAESWTAEGNTVTFVLGASEEVAPVAKLLGDRLFNVIIEIKGQSVKVSGIPAATMLDQVSSLSLTGESDPLADLADLGAVVAMDTPEAGGSIRASKPTALADMMGTLPQSHDPEERVQAEVLRVIRGAFPNVTLKVKLRSTARKGTLKSKLRSGRIIQAQVMVPMRDGQVDVSGPTAQTNLGAWYLSRGDRVMLHAVPASDDSLSIDWVERKQRK